MADYGYVFTKDAVKSQLQQLNRGYNGRRTWGEYYGAVDVAKQQALSQLEQDYSTDILDAYKTAQQNKSIVNTSQLGTGFKEQSFADIDASLMEAYNSYQQAYGKNIQSLETTIDAQKGAIDKALDIEAQNVKDYVDSPYKYLQDMYDRAYGNNNNDVDIKLQEMFANNPQWSKYLKDELDAEGNIIGKTIMSENELRSQFYDENGELNTRGVDFYDQMMNQLGTTLGTDYSYYNWLNTENPKLYEWSHSYNPYNYTEAGTNAGTVKTMLGMKSTDDNYQFVERYGGMNKNELSTMFNNFVNISEKLTDNVSSNASTYKEMFDNVKQLSVDLGIYDELDDAIGGWDKFENTISNELSAIQTADNVNHDIAVKTIQTYVKNIGSMTALGTAIVPGPGSIVGAIIGSIGATFQSIIDATDMRNKSAEQKQKSYKAIEQKYSDVAAAMTNYVLSKNNT